MKAIDALRKTCPINGNHFREKDGQTKAYSRHCSPGGCVWWITDEGQDDVPPDDQNGDCAIVFLANGADRLSESLDIGNDHGIAANLDDISDAIRYGGEEGK